MACVKMISAALGVLFLLVIPVFAGEIHDAATEGDIEKVKSLLAEIPELVNAEDDDEKTPLQYAAEAGHKDIVELLIARGADVNAKVTDGAPLHYAAHFGHKDIAELLIARGADVNAKMYHGTPLHCAAQRGHKDIVEFLIVNGADVNAKVTDGTPLHYAAQRGHKDIAELLIARGADVNARSKSGYTPLLVAAGSGHKDIAEFLIARGADVNAIDNDGGTLLHLAARNYGRNAAKFLIVNGADVNAKNKRGRTPLHLACEHDFGRDLAKLLITRGADVNAKDKDGKTPLHYAISKDRNDIVELLKGKTANGRTLEPSPVYSYQAIVDAFSKLQSEAQRSLESETQDQEKWCYAERNRRSFDVNKYFTVLKHISMYPSWKLDFVYCCERSDGEPFVYATRKKEKPYSTHTACSLFYSSQQWDQAEISLKEWVRNRNNLSKEYVNFVETDGTDKGFFELTVLYILGDRFMLNWHMNYCSRNMICSEQELISFFNSPSSRLPSSVKLRAKNIKVRPVVKMAKETVVVKVITFSDWRGFERRTLTFQRDFPHKILDEQIEVLVPYKSSLMF